MHPAETLSAGRFNVIFNNNEPVIGIGNSPNNTSGAIRVFQLDDISPFELQNTNNPGAGGDLFRLTFFDESQREVFTLFRRDSAANRVKEKHLRRARDNGATRVTVEQVS